MRWVLSFFICSIFSVGQLQAKHYIYVNDSLNKEQKEAILILPGLGDKNKYRKIQLAYFQDKGYDIYIPDYASRRSVKGCADNLTEFYFDYKLSEYSKVHCFAYILGSWTLNEFIRKEGRKNITTIIYDRSPLQERAPAVITKRIHPIVLLLKGRVVKDLSKIPYEELKNDSIQKAIIIESKATPLIRIFKKTTLKMGPVQWSVDSLYQPCNDYMYTFLHHAEMYHRFDVIGDEIFKYIRSKSFSMNTKREPYDWDPFEPYKD